jgi:hypothetical protein
LGDQHCIMPTITPLISKALTSTAYDVKWIPQSARLCTIGASNRGVGVISVYKMEGKQLVLANEVGNCDIAKGRNLYGIEFTDKFNRQRIS